MRTSPRIEHRQAELEAFLAQWFGDSEPAAPERPAPGPAPNYSAGNLTDDEILAKAPEAVNGAKFTRLFNGDCSGYQSQSQADQALFDILAFYCRCDAAQMDRLFLLSGLANREKAKRADYRNRTIAKAIAGCRETYTGGKDRGYESTGGGAADFAGLGDQGGADQAGQEQPAAELIDIQPLDLDAAIDNPPPPIHWHVDNYLLHGIVGIMTGTGGVGKSFEVIAMAVAKATGHEIPPFSASEPGRVLLLNVEDPDRELSRRVHHFAKTYPLTDWERALLRKNLIVLPGRGKVRPFMRLEYGSPVEDDSFRWFAGVVEQYDPELIFLDTKSRLYGLEENSTDHATRWLGLFERLLVSRPEMSIMIVSHTSKANSQSESAHADRGGSGFPDNARCVLVLCRPQDADLKRLGQDAAPHRFAKLVVAKQSYGPEAPPVFFEKDEHGVPVLVELRDTEAEARSAALDLLVDILRAEHHPAGLSKRELEQPRDNESCKKIRQEIMDATGIKAGDWKAVVLLGIESGRLIVETDESSSAPNKPKIIKARDTTEWCQDTSCQFDLFQLTRTDKKSALSVNNDGKSVSSN